MDSEQLLVRRGFHASCKYRIVGPFLLVLEAGNEARGQPAGLDAGLKKSVSNILPEGVPAFANRWTVLLGAAVGIQNAKLSRDGDWGAYRNQWICLPSRRLLQTPAGRLLVAPSVDQ